LKEVKKLCIKELENLIQNIKDDKTSDNYVYAMDVLEVVNGCQTTSAVVRYSITRNEYGKKNKQPPKKP